MFARTLSRGETEFKATSTATQGTVLRCLVLLGPAIGLAGASVVTNQNSRLLAERPTASPGSISYTCTAADRSSARIRPTLGVRQLALGRALSVLRWRDLRHCFGDVRRFAVARHGRQAPPSAGSTSLSVVGLRS